MKSNVKKSLIVSSIIIISLVLLFVFIEVAKPDVIGYVWLFSGLALMLIELFTPLFFLLPFGIGCWFAVIPNLLDAEFLVQVLVFFGSSLICWVFIGNFLHSESRSNDKNTKLNGDEIIGSVGYVVEPILPPMKGRVYYQGNTWLASADSQLEKGKEVVVISKEGITLIVKEKK